MSQICPLDPALEPHDRNHKETVELILVTASEVEVEEVYRILTATRDCVVAVMAVCS